MQYISVVNHPISLNIHFEGSNVLMKKQIKTFPVINIQEIYDYNLFFYIFPQFFTCLPNLKFSNEYCFVTKR